MADMFISSMYAHIHKQRNFMSRSLVFLWTNLKPNNRWRQISGLDVRHKSSLHNTSDIFLKGRYHINEDKLDANMVVWKISC